MRRAVLLAGGLLALALAGCGETSPPTTAEPTRPATAAEKPKPKATPRSAADVAFDKTWAAALEWRRQTDDNPLHTDAALFTKPLADRLPEERDRADQLADRIRKDPGSHLADDEDELIKLGIRGWAVLVGARAAMLDPDFRFVQRTFWRPDTDPVHVSVFASRWYFIPTEDRRRLVAAIHKQTPSSQLLENTKRAAHSLGGEWWLRR